MNIRIKGKVEEGTGHDARSLKCGRFKV
jgi:hypothetical protein